MKKSISTFLAVFLALAAAILLMVAGAIIFWFYQTKLASQPEVSPSPSPSEEAAVMATPTSLPTSTPEGTVAPRPGDLELIRQALASRHGRAVSDTEVTMRMNTGTYANGGVRFAGEIGGGWWLAAKVSGEWVIVDDGNGAVMCDKIEGYDFPTEMVPECFDEATGEVITR